MKTEDARVAKSKAQILTTTWTLLAQNGLGGVSVDEVSRLSGVAKTTIYRHWKSRTDLLIAACSQPHVELQVPDKGSVRDDLIILLNELGKMLRNAQWATVLPSVIDGAERDQDIAALHSNLQRAHARPFHEVIARAIKRGQLSGSADAATMVSMLMGALFYRRWFSRERIDLKFIRTIVDQVLT